MRRLLLGSPRLAALIVAAALLLRVMVPAGFMPVFGHHGVVIAICSGAGPAVAMSGMKHHLPDEGAPKSQCAFADLSLVAIGGADPVQLAEALAYVLALALLLAGTCPVATPARLRPPLRAPPVA